MLLGALVILNQDKVTIDRVDQSEEEESVDFLPRDLTALVMDETEGGISSNSGEIDKPSVKDLQRRLQEAWDDGYDSKGKALYYVR